MTTETKNDTTQQQENKEKKADFRRTSTALGLFYAAAVFGMTSPHILPNSQKAQNIFHVTTYTLLAGGFGIGSYGYGKRGFHFFTNLLSKKKEHTR